MENEKIVLPKQLLRSGTSIGAKGTEKGDRRIIQYN